MELEKIVQGLTEPQKLIETIKNTKGNIEYEKYSKQYDPLKHDVIIDTTNYPDKVVKTDTGTKIVPVARISFAFQELIVESRANFLCGNPIELTATAEKESTEDNLLSVIKKTLEDNKLDYENRTLAKLMMSECDCAEVWYAEDAKDDYWKGTPNQGKPLRFRMKILANSLGDSLYPVFNKMGDMIAFCRGYCIKEDDEEIQYFDIYNDTVVYAGVKTKDKDWTFETKAHGFDKMPIIYYSQPRPEWYSVQTSIHRFEMSVSRHGNANDYMGFPLMAVYGKIESFADKGDDGKVIELESGAEIEMITWEQAPESIKLEQQTHLDNIFGTTGTPRLYGEDLTSAGNYSGAAMKLRFFPAHLKAAEKEGIFGKGIQRRINFLKSANIKINPALNEAGQLQIKPRFKYFTPQNVQEDINILVSALSGDKPIMSQETAIDLNPLIEDKEAEKIRIGDEKKEADKAQEAFNKSAGGLDNQMNNIEVA